MSLGPQEAWGHQRGRLFTLPGDDEAGDVPKHNEQDEPQGDGGLLAQLRGEEEAQVEGPSSIGDRSGDARGRAVEDRSSIGAPPGGALLRHPCCHRLEFAKMSKIGPKPHRNWPDPPPPPDLVEQTRNSVEPALPENRGPKSAGPSSNVVEPAPPGCPQSRTESGRARQKSYINAQARPSQPKISAESAPMSAETGPVRPSPPQILPGPARPNCLDHGRSPLQIRSFPSLTGAPIACRNRKHWTGPPRR